jgi:hypothetical protein
MHRRSELEALKAAEVARQQAAGALTSSCASACLALTHSHAQPLSTAAADLSRMLLSLLDGCVLPADLVPAPEGDDALASLQRLSLEELSRLAAAQDAAQPVGKWRQHEPRSSHLVQWMCSPGPGMRVASQSRPLLTV